MLNEPLSWELVKRIGVYVYIPDGPFDGWYLHYGADCLIDGLRAIGVPVFSNLDIPNVEKHALADMRDHVYVFFITERAQSADLMKGVGEFAAPYRLMMSFADSTSTLVSPPKVPALLTHQTSHWKVTGTREPWGFGLNNWRMNAAAGGLDYSQREPKAVCNFSTSYNQAVRNILELALLPLLERASLEADMQKSDRDGHYRRLKTYQACMCYGGHIIEDPARFTPELGAGNYQFRKAYVEADTSIIVLRWDSWRWWEAMGAGCLAFQLHLEKYGLLLPVMPEPWVHYVPLDFSDLAGTIEHLSDIRDQWGTIAENGHKWALEHYSPTPTAKRFVETAIKYFG